MSKSPIWERLSAPKDKGEDWRAEKRKQYAAEGMKRFASPSNGYFGTPQSLAVGSPYKDPEYALKHPRGGAQFHSLGSGRGNASPDGALSKAPSIHVGDEYIDPGRKRVLYAKSLREKWLDRPGFKPAGKIKEPLPIFQSEIDAFSEPGEVKQLLKTLNARGPKQKKEEFEPKNFVTSPAKKGGFGVAGTLMPQYAGEVQEMWKYQPSEYDRARMLEKEENAKQRAKMEGKAPFKPRNSLGGQTTFSNNIECYGDARGEDKGPREKGRHQRLALERAREARERYLARKDAEAAQDRPAFKPTSPPKKSVHYDPKQTLSPYPEHLPDPKVESNFFATEKPRQGQVPWKPNNKGSSKPIKSILIGTIAQRNSARSGGK